MIFMIFSKKLLLIRKKMIILQLKKTNHIQTNVIYFT